VGGEEALSCFCLGGTEKMNIESRYQRETSNIE